VRAGFGANIDHVRLTLCIKMGERHTVNLLCKKPLLPGLCTIYARGVTSSGGSYD
jgi:hypothetical protein